MSTTATQTVTESPRITGENVRQLFPDVNTNIIGAAVPGVTRDADLQGYDEEQIRLMDEMCIVLDDDDNPIGSGSKKICTSNTPTCRTMRPTNTWSERRMRIRGEIANGGTIARDRPSYGEHR